MWIFFHFHFHNIGFFCFFPFRFRVLSPTMGKMKAKEYKYQIYCISLLGIYLNYIMLDIQKKNKIQNYKNQLTSYKKQLVYLISCSYIQLKIDYRYYSLNPIDVINENMINFHDILIDVLLETNTKPKIKVIQDYKENING